MKRQTFQSILLTITFFVMLGSASCSTSMSAFHASTLKPVAAASEISLMDHNNNPFQLSNMRGKVVLLTFGFTNCVDECPLTMANLNQSLEMLGDGASAVQVVLVSTDPVRDSPQMLKDFLSHFNPAFLGISGTYDEMSKVWSNYGVEVMDGGETHSSFVYAIDKGGNLRLKIDAETAPEDIASDLKILLAED